MQKDDIFGVGEQHSISNGNLAIHCAHIPHLLNTDSPSQPLTHLVIKFAKYHSLKKKMYSRYSHNLVAVAIFALALLSCNGIQGSNVPNGVDSPAQSPEILNAIEKSEAMVSLGHNAPRHGPVHPEERNLRTGIQTIPNNPINAPASPLSTSFNHNFLSDPALKSTGNMHSDRPTAMLNVLPSLPTQTKHIPEKHHGYSHLGNTRVDSKLRSSGDRFSSMKQSPPMDAVLLPDAMTMTSTPSPPVVSGPSRQHSSRIGMATSGLEGALSTPTNNQHGQMDRKRKRNAELQPGQRKSSKTSEVASPSFGPNDVTPSPALHGANPEESNTPHPVSEPITRKNFLEQVKTGVAFCGDSLSAKTSKCLTKHVKACPECGLKEGFPGAMYRNAQQTKRWAEIRNETPKLFK